MSRAPFIVAAALVIPLGLGVRAVGLPGGLDGPLGDALWSVELYCVLRALRPRAWPPGVALLCFVLSVLDEASQAIHTPWLDAIRATTIGHLLLGRGFVWMDMLWYAAGTVGALVTELAVRRARASRDAPRPSRAR